MNLDDEIEQEEFVRALASKLGSDAYPDDLDESARVMGLEAQELHNRVMNHRSTAEKVVEFPRPPLDWLESFELSEGDLQQIEDQRYVIDGLIPEGHITVIVGRAGTGKTTIIYDMAREMVHSGYTVIYVHSDTHPPEAKKFRELAMVTGVRYLTPDMKVDASMAGVLKNLQTMASTGISLKGTVVVFDTMKKLTRMIQKESVAELMRVLRKISAAGSTIVLLGHVNKRREDGKDMYEGTGDLENDCDNLIYFVPKHEEDSVLVSSVCDPAEGQGKMRADITPMSWRIFKADRRVVPLDEYADVVAMNAEAAKRDADDYYIETITEAINSGCKSQSEIVDHCKEHHSQGHDQVRRTLKRWRNDLWRERKYRGEGNRTEYTLIETLPQAERVER